MPIPLNAYSPVVTSLGSAAADPVISDQSGPYGEARSAQDNPIGYGSAFSGVVSGLAWKIHAMRAIAW